MIDTFSEEIRKEIFRRDGEKCVNCEEKNKFLLSFHHLIHNTKVERRNYGNERVQSAENGVTVCQQCHSNYTLWDRARVKTLRELWEPFNQSKLRRVAV